jgi:hypothetical protein
MEAATKSISGFKGKAFQSMSIEPLLQKKEVVRVNTRGSLKLVITPSLNIESTDSIVVQLD